MSEVLFSAVNNLEVLRQNLQASPAVVAGELPLRVYSGESSAAHAYNRALSETDAEIVIFAHQDVYLPARFLTNLRRAIHDLEVKPGPSWAVLGLFGATEERQRVGHVWSSGIGRELGTAFGAPVPVVSVDELLIIVRRSSGVIFDDLLPGFHLYGTDIVQAALSRGFGAYVVHAPVIHNSNPGLLRPDYWRAYHRLARRWRERLPIPTCILPVTRRRWREFHYRANQVLERLFDPPPRGKRQPDPAAIATRLCF